MKAPRIPPVAFIVLIIASLPSSVAAQKREKLPKPTRMDANIRFYRDAQTGQLTLERAPAVMNPPQPSRQKARAAIRVHVNLVEVGCNVFSPDGTAVRGLKEENFRVFEDGQEQKIAHFDASSQGASIALILDASPSVLPDATAMKDAAQGLIANLSPADEVAVVDFSEHTYLLLPFSRDRDRLVKAIAGVDVRGLFGDTGGSNIYRSVYLVARELFPGRTGRKAVILLTDGQDSGLGLNLDGQGVRPARGQPANRPTFEDVVQALSSQGILAYVISTQNRPKVMTPAWLAEHRNDSLVTPAAVALGIPAYTDFLAELVRQVGGQLYFLDEFGSVADAYRQIVQNLSAQYTLGFYPPPHHRPGWHTLRVDVLGRGRVRVVHRAAFYAPPISR